MAVYFSPVRSLPQAAVSEAACTCGHGPQDAVSRRLLLKYSLKNRYSGNEKIIGLNL
jgi:hypothetical protein